MHKYELLRGVHGNKKVQTAYYTFGMPDFIIIEECHPADLLYLEKEYINTLSTKYTLLNIFR